MELLARFERATSSLPNGISTVSRCFVKIPQLLENTAFLEFSVWAIVFNFSRQTVAKFSSHA
jgi:hypothetical protein